MTTNYNLNGTDLDSIFAPWHSGWPQAAATGIKVAGADLNGRYATLSSGTGASGTTFKVNSVDLNQIFAAIGSTSVRVGTQPTAVSGSAAAGQPSGVVTSGAATCAGAKGSGSYSYLWVCSGCTANNPHSATTTFYATVNAGSVDNASAYCQISDVITSVNTNTIPVTLHNTTPAYLFNGTVAAGEIQTGSGPSEIRQIGWAVSTLTGGTVMGSISPSADINGNSIGAIYSSETGAPVPSSYGMVLFIAGTLSQNYFTTMTANGHAFSSASATLIYQSGYTSWQWNAATMTFPTANQNYSVIIQ